MTTKAVAAYNAGREHYQNYGYREAPLSGEWAGESMGELSTTYGVDLSDPDMQDAFEDGYFSAEGEADVPRT